MAVLEVFFTFTLRNVYLEHGCHIDRLLSNDIMSPIGLSIPLKTVGPYPTVCCRALLMHAENAVESRILLTAYDSRIFVRFTVKRAHPAPANATAASTPLHGRWTSISVGMIT